MNVLSELLSYRYSTSLTDEVVSVRGGSEVHEGLRRLAQLGSAVGDHDKWSLNLVAAVLHVFLGAGHAANRDGFDAFLAFYCGQGSVADCARVALNSLDNSAGGGQLLGQYASILGAGDRFETISCAGTSFTADGSYRTGIAAYFAPVATVVPSRPAAVSSSFRALEERPISAEPEEAASIPVPEPVGS